MNKKSLFIRNPNLSSLPMQFITKKFLIISSFIIALEFNQSNIFASDKYAFDDFGLISIMYHRFGESKYPSTNIQVEIFQEQLRVIEDESIKFIHPKNFEKVSMKIKMKEKFYLQ